MVKRCLGLFIIVSKEDTVIFPPKCLNSFCVENFVLCIKLCVNPQLKLPNFYQFINI